MTLLKLLVPTGNTDCRTFIIKMSKIIVAFENTKTKKSHNYKYDDRLAKAQEDGMGYLFELANPKRIMEMISKNNVSSVCVVRNRGKWIYPVSTKFRIVSDKYLWVDWECQPQVFPEIRVVNTLTDEKENIFLGMSCIHKLEVLSQLGLVPSVECSDKTKLDCIVERGVCICKPGSIRALCESFDTPSTATTIGSIQISTRLRKNRLRGIKNRVKRLHDIAKRMNCKVVDSDGIVVSENDTTVPVPPPPAQAIEQMIVEPEEAPVPQMIKMERLKLSIEHEEQQSLNLKRAYEDSQKHLADLKRQWKARF